MLPSHVAIIPDGNRRWAKKQGYAAIEGHKQGLKNFYPLLEETFRQGIPYLTFWGASEDNLTKRSPLEAGYLADLFKNELASSELREKLEKNEIRLRVVGRWNEILKDLELAEAIHAAQEKTARFSKACLTILFGYDGKREMLEGVRTMVRASAPGDTEINYDSINKALWTGYLPSADLIIRTGEEQAGWVHWSAGFMMWKTAYSQIYSTATLWPDFSKEELNHALTTYSNQKRRFGK